ncbi:MAG TPA: hypothetical protein VNA24_08115 [Hyalangium sp.]|nr:hypothetical protein [Hyalangium sp.]
MPSSIFQSLQRALELIAGSPRRAGAEPQPTLSATLDDLTIIYTLNDAERVLTVVSIFRLDSRR